jgi:hypothetical protein
LAAGRLDRRGPGYVNAQTGDWYVPITERRGARGAIYLRYLTDGPANCSAAVAVVCHGYRDEEPLLSPHHWSENPNGGHTWLTLHDVGGRRAVSGTGVAKGEMLDSFRFFRQDQARKVRMRLAHGSRRMLGTSERIVDGSDATRNYPDSLIELFVTERTAAAMELDIAAHEWTAGQGKQFSSARFNAINLRGRNCAAYVVGLFEGVGINFKTLLGIKETSPADAFIPLLPLAVHRAAFRAAESTAGARLPVRRDFPETSVHPFALPNGKAGSGGNVYLVHSGEVERPSDSVGEILRRARALDVVFFDESGGLRSRLPPELVTVAPQRAPRIAGPLTRFGARHAHLVTNASIALHEKATEALALTGLERKTD